MTDRASTSVTLHTFVPDGKGDHCAFVYQWPLSVRCNVAERCHKPPVAPFDYCTGIAHYLACPVNPKYHPAFNFCGHWHVWFGESPALIGPSSVRCPNWNGDYAATKPTRCEVHNEPAK